MEYVLFYLRKVNQVTLSGKVRVQYGGSIPTPGGYSTQSWVSTVKLIEKAVAVNLHTEGVVTFP